MRVVVRSLVATLVALLGAIVLAVSWTTMTAVQLMATALIMGGTDHPLSSPQDDPVLFINPYMNNAVMVFINAGAAAPTGTGGDPIGVVGPTDDRYAVITPEEFFPIFGSKTLDVSVGEGFANLNSCVRGDGCEWNEDGALIPPAPDEEPVPTDDFVIFGYSQSAAIASLLKKDLIENPEATPTIASFFLLANPMRPNGGILARGPEGVTIPILGVTFYGATPTDSCDTGPCYATIDAAAQYDGLGGDAPASLTNVLAILNAAAGYYYLHGELQDNNFDNALYQGSHGDTDYYLYPTERLPILMPFEAFVPSPILTLLDAPLRAAIEGAYARDVNPGIATGVGLLPFRDPVQAILNIIAAVPTGIDDALSEATGDPTFRPLGTAPVTSPFGVGGPQLPAPPEALTTLSAGEDAGEQDAFEVQSLGADGPGREDDEALPEEPGTTEEEPGEDALEEEADEAAEEERGEEAAEEAAEEEAEDGTPGPNTPPATETDLPEVRGPIEFDSQEQDDAPSADQPGDGQTTSGDPDPSADGADGADSADGEAAA